jgi:threonyl-tRNA synthetase
LDDKAESLGKKIRNAEMKKIPYMIIIGDKEKEAKKISVRSKKDGDMGALAVKKFVESLKKEIEEKK